MKIKKIRAVSGPNLYHRLPILVMTIDLGDLAEVSSADMPGFTDRLVEALPGLGKHRCSKGYEGGFIERLRTGTYLGHIIEHIALELSEPAGIEVGYGKTVYAGTPGHYDVIVRYRCEKGMRSILKTSVEFAQAVIAGESYPLADKVAEAREIADDLRFGPSTQALVDAAVKRGIPWTRLSEDSLVEFGYGIHRRRIQATTSSETDHIAVDIAQDKNLTKILLERALLPVPGGEVVADADAAVEAFESMGGTVTIKPLDGNHGRGVCLDLKTEASVREAFAIARKHSRKVIVEEYITGRDYRIVVIGGKMVAAAERVPAHVIGDGIHSVSQLIELENRNPLRGRGHEKPLTQITVDDAAEAFLRRSGIELESVPAFAERVVLRETANLSTGGSAVDVTDRIHPQLKSLSERAALQVGLDICGIDLIAEDISRPLASQKCAIIEVNAGPGIRMHHFPSEGKSRDVAGAIIDELFPNHSDGRIPVVTITGTNGKTTVTRLIAHTVGRTDRKVGMTTSDGIFLGKECIYQGDTTGPQSAKVVLSDPRVEVAVLETARGGIVRRGLGFEKSDVAVITNVQPDHIGQDGIESVEDILRIKGLLAEMVRPGGTVVLNADDPLVLSLRDKPAVKIEEKTLVLFSTDSENVDLRRHIESGGIGYYYRDGGLYEAKAYGTSYIAEASKIPATFGGAAIYQISNVLASLAASRALGLSIEEARAGVETFHPTLDNSGRANAYRVGNGYVFIDYGHNPEALRAITAMGRQLTTGILTGIISAPGDRSEAMIRMSGKAAAEGFDRVIVREDIDLRGRPAGETAALLRDEIRGQNPKCDCIVLHDQKEALRAALSTMKNGEIVMYFYDRMDAAKEVLSEFDAEPLTDLHEFFSFSSGKFLEVC